MDVQADNVLWGGQLAESITQDLRARVAELKVGGVEPRLAIIHASHDPASNRYVALKIAQGIKIGVAVEEVEVASTLPDILAAIDRLNVNSAVHGTIVQLPLVGDMHQHRVTSQILNRIAPGKDVDGLGRGAFNPATKQGFPTAGPAGILALLQHHGVQLASATVSVVGRGRTMGEPLELLLRAVGAKVHMFYLPDRPIVPAVLRASNVVIGATNSPVPPITASHVRPGMVVIDATGSPRSQIAQDVKAVAGVKYTPPTGGVGPMTVAMLLKNVVEAATKSAV